ncbi:MAG: ATP-binding protein [Acidobacteriota bacterium]
MTRPYPTSPPPHGAAPNSASSVLPEGRFEGLERLSPEKTRDDAFGVSFRAFDRRRARPVLVRSLAGIDPVVLYRLREPVARVQRIFHEHLTPILEAQLLGETPFWLREFVGGSPFVEAFRDAIQNGDDARAAQWIGETLEGLDTLARYGLSHGHVTSNNLRVVNGRVVFLDYALRGSASTEEDLRRFTALLAEAVAGVDAPSRAWRRLDIAEPSEGLGHAGLLDLAMAFDPPPAASPLLLDRPFVGRETELKRIHRAALRTRRGASVTLLVEGPAGIGRSALLARSKRLIEAQHTESLVLAVGCQRQTRPGGALQALLENLIDHFGRLPPREVEVILPARPRELAFQFPVFLRLESVARAAPSTEERADALRLRSIAALRQLFDRVAERRPLVLILDGAERADAESLEVLRQVLQPPDPPPLLLLIGLEPRSPRSSALEELVAPHRHKTASSKVERLTLGPLSPRDAAWMTKSLIGANAEKGLVDAIAQSARGLPSWIVRLVDDALDAYPANDAQLPPEGLRAAALGRRLATLSKAAAVLLRGLTFIGRPVGPEIATRLCDISPGELEPVLDQLLAEDLIRHYAGESTYAVTDGLIVETVFELVGDDGPELHAAVAQVLDAVDAPPEELARHWRAAGDAARAGQAARAGAIRAQGRGRHEESAELWQLALDMAEVDSQERLPLLRQRAKALDRAGDFAGSSKVYLEASELGPADAADLRRLAADRSLVNGDPEVGLELLEPLLDRTGLRPMITPPAGPADRLRSLWRSVRRRLGLAGRRATGDPESLLSVDVAWTLCRGLRIVAPGRAEELSREHLARSLRSGDRNRRCRALSLETAHQAYGGWRRRARVEKLGHRAITLARQLDEPRMRGLAEVMAGEAWLLLGEWRRALSAIDRGLLILESECPEAWWERRVALFQQLRCLAMLGKLGDISHLLGECRRSETVNRAPFLRHSLESRFGWLVERAEDRPREAVRILEERRKAPDFSSQPSYWQLYGEVEVAIYRGDVHYAWHHLDEFWATVVQPRLVDIEFLRIEAWHQRARAALAALAMRPHGHGALELRRAAAGAMEVLEKISSPWSDAVALLVRGGLESFSDDRYGAAATLQRAESRLDHLDMTLHVQAARRQRALLVPSAVASDRLADADRRIAELGVATPERMANLVVPGFWQPTTTR